jgi:uncharacterized protein YyaL (SSP411 family)
MSEGGIYDHLGGGYARYSVDAKWLVPHFEKMLYDNAQILDMLALEHARAPNELYRQRAEETVGWLKREMLTKEGGFASSLDADSEGEEGKFYVWSQAEIAHLLGPDDATFFAAKYGVSAEGNFEGHNILNRLDNASETAVEAEQLAAMIPDELALHEATGDHLFLDQAILWQADLDTHYGDPQHGGYYLTSDDAEGLILRPHSSVDDAIPNHTGLTAQNLARLAVLTGDERWRRQLDTLFARMLPVAAANMFGHLSLLNALDLYLAGAEIVVTGQGDDAEVLLKAARSLPHANTIVLYVPDPAKLPAHHPAAGKIAAGGGAAAFVCRNQTCSLPVTEPETLAALVLREDASAPGNLLQ